MRAMDRSSILDRPTTRRLPRVSIVPRDDAFDITVNDELILTVADELDAHHWAKHVTECVNSGVTRAFWIRESLPKLCEVATRGNLHSGFPGDS